MKVEQILDRKGRDVFAVSTSTSIAEAIDMLNDRNIGAIVVVDDDSRVVGILSERDVVRRISREREALLSRQVGDVMTADPVTCDTDSSSDELMAVMTTRRIRHVPVVGGGRLIGLISIGDIVKCRIEETEQEAAALRDYIAS
jgi:CBS domain-containing protein